MEERKVVLKLGEYYSMNDLERAYRGHWFSPGAMRFFKSRLGSEVLPVPDGWLFVSSERFDYNTPRLYTIRKMDQYGEISEVGEFQEYTSSASARRVMRRLYEEGKPETTRLREIRRQEQDEQNDRYMATMRRRLAAQQEG